MRISDWSSDVCSSDLPCAAQLVETNEGLVLIDTGYGSEDVRHPHPRLSRFFRTLLNIHFRAEETALHQIKAMGYSPSDRSEEHTSELQSLMRISYAVFCLKKKKHITQQDTTENLTQTLN